MDKGWNNIREQINNKEAPLTENAWTQLETQLPKGGKRKIAWWWIVLASILVIGSVALWPTNTSNLKAETESLPKSNKEVPAEESTNKGTPVPESTIVLGTTEGEDDAFLGTNKNVTQPKSDQPEQSTSGRGITFEEQNATESKQTLEAQVTDKQEEETSNNQIPDLVSRAQVKEETNQHKEAEMAQESLLGKSAEEEAENNQEVHTEDIYEGTQNNAKLYDQSAFYRWELKAFGGFTYNSSNVIYNAVQDYSHKDLESASENGVQPGLGVDAGVEVSLYAWRFLKISSGIGIRRFETQNSLDYQVDNIPVIDSATGQILGYLPTANPIQYSDNYVNRYTYLSVPVSLFYEHRLSNRWSVTGEFVNTAQFLVQQNSRIVNPKDLNIEESNDDLFNSTVFTYQFRAGVRYYLNNQTAIALEPAYRGHYNNIYNSEAITWKPTDLSLNLAVIYKLKLSKPKKEVK